MPDDEAPSVYRKTSGTSKIQDLESGFDGFEELKDFELPDFDTNPFLHDKSAESPEPSTTTAE